MINKIRKLVFVLLSCICMCGMSVTSFATTEYVDGYLRYTVVDGSVTITGYNGKESEVTVPSKIAGVPVNVIAAGAFSNATTVTKVNLPDTIMTIEENAFNMGQTVVYSSNQDDTTTPEPEQPTTPPTEEPVEPPVQEPSEQPTPDNEQGSNSGSTSDSTQPPTGNPGDSSQTQSPGNSSGSNNEGVFDKEEIEVNKGTENTPSSTLKPITQQIPQSSTGNTGDSIQVVTPTEPDKVEDTTTESADDEEAEVEIDDDEDGVKDTDMDNTATDNSTETSQNDIVLVDKDISDVAGGKAQDGGNGQTVLFVAAIILILAGAGAGLYVCKKKGIDWKGLFKCFK